MFKKSLLKQTREAWLNQVTLKFIVPHFKKHGLTIPKVRLSIGVPYGRDPHKVVGQCFDTSSSADKVSAIFISPTQDDPHQVFGTLIHELIHATIGVQEGHGKVFRDTALKLGLVPPMRSTRPNPELEKTIAGWVKKAGKFPHSKLSFANRKKQGTRLIKMTCAKDEYTVRAAKTPIEAMGAVICPVCRKAMKVEMPEDDGE